MSIIGSNILAGASGQATGYNINNSLRFRSSNSAYLSRTFTTPTDGKKWTWSGWVKRGILTNGTGTVQQLFSAGSATGFFRISQTDTLLAGWTGASNLETTQVFRDPSAWYHIMLVVDTTQATASNRVKYYVNGSQITAFATTDYPTQNSTTTINSAVAHNIAAYTSSSQYFDGYMTEINFVDGQALTPSSFGETDTTTGSWKPKAYTGTYGTNGFYLKFADASAATAAAIGKDSSGNGNNWTPSGISVTAGVTYDAMIDVPTNTSATVANYCVMNPLTNLASLTVSNANLSVSASNGNWKSVLGTMALPSTGKWYWEVTVVGTAVGQEIIGVANTVDNISSSYSGSTANTYGYQSSGSKNNNATGTAYGASYTTNDIIGVAVDTTAGTIVFYKNNTSQGTAFTGLSSSYSYIPVGSMENAASNLAFNFGQRPFSYTPPTGYVALNTYNLPDSTIVKGNTVMDATLYTGNGTTNTITNASGFKPDFLWTKSRSNGGGGYNNIIFDSVRGTSKSLATDLTGTEYTGTDLTSFNSNGFTAAAPNQWFGVNNSGATFVAWQWQAGQGTNTSNTNGSITSTVSVNATAGFSVVTYTGTGANATVGHGLGVAPSMIMAKSRSVAADWNVYHTSLGATKALYLNRTTAATTSSVFWNNTAPTSSVFSLGNTGDVNTNASTNVAYCWAEIAGFSKFGSYTGNGSTDGPFVYTGFRPKFVLIKRTDVTGNWRLHDTSRDTYNVTQAVLYPNLSNAEATGSNEYWDLLSNGFKLRTSDSEQNASGGTYIFMAFAENPFKNANAR